MYKSNYILFTVSLHFFPLMLYSCSSVGRIQRNSADGSPANVFSQASYFVWLLIKCLIFHAVCLWIMARWCVGSFMLIAITVIYFLVLITNYGFAFQQCKFAFEKISKLLITYLFKHINYIYIHSTITNIGI